MKKINISDPLSVLSASMLILMTVVDSVLGGPDLVANVSENFVFSIGILLSVHPAKELGRSPLYLAGPMGAFFCLAKAVSVAGYHFSLAAVLLSEIFVLWRFYGEKISRIMILFRELTPKKYFEDLTFVMLHVIYQIIAVVACVLVRYSTDLMGVMILLLSAAFYSVTLFLRFKRKIPMFHSSTILRMYDKYSVAQKSNAHNKHINAQINLRAIYDRAEVYMRTKKPFLLEGFKLKDLAERIYVNYAYLSRAVNTYSGKRFRLWLNTFRVEYSIELFKQDMHIKINVLARLSGFKSPVTYNSTFHIVMGEKPSDYFKRIKQDSE